MNFCSAESSAPMRTTNYEQAAATQGSLRIPSLVFGRRNRTGAAAGPGTGARGALQFVLGVFFVLIINKRTGLAAGVGSRGFECGSPACVLDTPERILMDECSGGVEVDPKPITRSRSTPFPGCMCDTQPPPCFSPPCPA